MGAYRIDRFGWLPDPPDHRDSTIRHLGVQGRLATVLPRLSVGVAPSLGAPSPVGVLRADLRPWCTPIEHQGQIGACTAHAVVGALEYFERKSRGEYIDASRRFLYRVTRRYLHWDGRGDTGAFVRSAIKSLRLFGVPPEEYWPYDEAKYDEEPSAFVYALAANFKTVEYFRLEESGSQLKSALKAGLPFAFGFTCFNSIFDEKTAQTGVIPYPNAHDEVIGGHAVLAVGYTDSHILIRNSWGTSWGQQGYGFLPWQYFDRLRPLASDCWSILNAAWVPASERTTPVAKAVAAGARPLRGAAFASVLPVVAPSGPPPRSGGPRPLIRVSRGTDPTQAVPLRLSPLGVASASPDARVALPVSEGPVALSVKSLKLNKSFDTQVLPQVFGKAVNELYLVTLAWDLSGAPPLVYPPKSIQPTDLPHATYQAQQGETVSFVGDGIELWPAKAVVGGLYVRLFILESDEDVRKLGKTLVKVGEFVGSSALAAALAAVATAGTSAAVAAVATAAAELTKLVGAALEKNEDDLIAVFDGHYGADHDFVAADETYSQNGVDVVLNIRT